MPALPKVVTRGEADAAVVELPRALAAFWKGGTELSVVAYGPEAALLVKGPLPTGHLAGSLGTYSLAELFGQLVSGILTGKLVVNSGAARRTVTVRDGQVVFASSTESHERLGRALVRLGMLTEAQLAEALKKVRPGVKLGQVVTQGELLSPQRLYSAMAYLVREIVVDLFALTEGDFLFFEHPRVDEALKLQERTRDLVLQGIQRGEEVRRLRALYPGGLQVTLGDDASDVPEWLAAASGGTELSTLRQGFEGSEHGFLSAVHEAMEQKLLQPAGVLPVTGESAEAGPKGDVSALELYQELVRVICQALVRAGRGLGDLRAFLAEPLPGMESAFTGVTLSDSGELDLERVHRNLAQASRSEALARAQAYEALDAFISYALFSAKNAMAPELAEALGREFRRLQEEHGG